MAAAWRVLAQQGIVMRAMGGSPRRVFLGRVTDVHDMIFVLNINHTSGVANARILLVHLHFTLQQRVSGLVGPISPARP